MRDAFVRALVREMENNRRVIIITGDLGFGVLKPFWSPTHRIFDSALMPDLPRIPVSTYCAPVDSA